MHPNSLSLRFWLQFIVAETFLVGGMKAMTTAPTWLYFVVGFAVLVVFVGLEQSRFSWLLDWSMPMPTITPQLLTSIGLIGVWIFAAVALAGVFWQRRGYPPSSATTAPVFDAREADPLRWSFLGKNPNFLMGKTTDYGVEIRGFQAIGRNETGEFLKGLRGHVKSLRNGQTYPLFTVHRNELVPLADHGVPGGHQFMVRAPFFDGAGIPVVKFISEFGALTFVFEYNGVSYTHNFSAEDVESQAQWLEEDLKPKPKKSEAGVIPLPERRISEQQKRIIAETLRESDWSPDSVWLRYFNPCEECRKYASDLRAALTLAGWNGDFGQTLDQREDLFGLKLYVADLNAKPRTAVLVALALERASVHFDWSPWPEIEKDRTILFAYPLD